LNWRCEELYHQFTSWRALHVLAMPDHMDQYTSLQQWHIRVTCFEAIQDT
jgi:hypothetical protein